MSNDTIVEPQSDPQSNSTTPSKLQPGMLYQPQATPWKIRRRVVALTLLFCAGIITYLVMHGADTTLNATIASGLILLAGAVIGSYIFGAVWDDFNITKTVGGSSYGN